MTRARTCGRRYRRNRHHDWCGFTDHISDALCAADYRGPRRGHGGVDKSGPIDQPYRDLWNGACGSATAFAKCNADLGRGKAGNV